MTAAIFGQALERCSLPSFSSLASGGGIAATAATPWTQGWRLHVARDRIRAPGYLQLSDRQTGEAELPGIGKPVSDIWVLLEQLGSGFLYPPLSQLEVSEYCSSWGGHRSAAEG